jgi:hypothetical protein
MIVIVKVAQWFSMQLFVDKECAKSIALLDHIACHLEQDRLFLVERTLGRIAAKPRRILRLVQL